MYRFKQITLLIGDLICLYAGLYLAVFIRYFSWKGERMEDLIAPMTILFLGAATIGFIAGLYDCFTIRNEWKFFKKIPLVAGIWILLGIIFFYIIPDNNINPKTILLLNALFGFLFIIFWRYIYNRFISTNILRNKIIFLGFTPEALELAELLGRHPERGYEIIGLVEPLNQQIQAVKEIGEILSTSVRLPVEKDLESAIAQAKSDPNNLIIVVSPPARQNKEILQVLYQKFFENIAILELDKFYEEMTGRIPPFTFSENWFLSNFQEQNKKIYDRFKTILDYFLGVAMAIIFLIFFIPTASAIKINSRGPIFFKQKRLGKNGREFIIYKFRTMKALAPDGSAELTGAQFAQKKDYRVTGVGNFLRKTRIDEIPQFINILKGEMSFIGPRPERPEFVKDLIKEMPFYRLRLLIKPGLTGWAQIQQGYAGSRDENLRKLEYDLYYIKNRSPLLDLGIGLRTINIVLRLGGQ